LPGSKFEVQRCFCTAPDASHLLIVAHKEMSPRYVRPQFERALLWILCSQPCRFRPKMFSWACSRSPWRSPNQPAPARSSRPQLCCASLVTLGAHHSLRQRRSIGLLVGAAGRAARCRQRMYNGWPGGHPYFTQARPLFCSPTATACKESATVPVSVRNSFSWCTSLSGSARNESCPCEDSMLS